MKKQLSLIVFALSISVGAWAQKSSVKLQVGYGMPIASSNFSKVLNYSNVTGSLGSGLTIEVGYTYSIAPLISTQLDIGYLLGSETKGSYSNSNLNAMANNSFKGNFLQAAPMIRFDVGESKIHPYVAVGPMFAFGNMTENYFESYDGTLETETKYTASASVGTKSVLGLELTKGNLGFFVQATMINMNYVPTKAEYTKYNNGQDQLPNMTTYSKIVEFKDSIDPYAPIDPNQPRQELKTYYAFSSLALNLGVRLKI